VFFFERSLFAEVYHNRAFYCGEGVVYVLAVGCHIGGVEEVVEVHVGKDIN